MSIRHLDADLCNCASFHVYVWALKPSESFHLYACSVSITSAYELEGDVYAQERRSHTQGVVFCARKVHTRKKRLLVELLHASFFLGRRQLPRLAQSEETAHVNVTA
jgi:hypothetical protein